MTTDDTTDDTTDEHGPAEGTRATSGRRQRIVVNVLIGRSVVVILLGVSLLVTGAGRPILGNLFAMYWIIGSVVTMLWARSHRDVPGSRLALVSGAVGLIAGLLAFARLTLLEWTSPNTVLTILGISALSMGALRLTGSLRDDPRLARRSWRRTTLGVGEIALGVLWIVSDHVTDTVITAVGLWGLLGGSIMLLDGLELRRTPAATILSR